MDSFHMYFGGSKDLFNYGEEAEEDSGVEDVPFSFFTPDLYPSSDTSTQNCAINPADDEDLTYIDDMRDDDYRPNRSSHSKKHKRPHKRRQFSGNTCLSQLMTPEKQQHDDFIEEIDVVTMRHYARKDRTPNTILKMMEKHRESERVRHHTLNESMKDVCMRVPGYDPDAKETKVIQMQRIIAYECFLENTLNSISELIDMNPKTLRIGTNFITDAMKNTPIEEFYQPSHYRTSDVEDEGESVLISTIKQEKPDTSNMAFELPRRSSYEKKPYKYPPGKISSPTIDSTTIDLVKLLPVSSVKKVPAYQFVTGNCIPAQCFVPIDNAAKCAESSQESGIKMEATQSTIYDEDNHFHDDISTFMDHEQLKAVTPSFMIDEANTSTTSNTESEQFQAFDLSSPDRHHGKVFLQSPRSTSVWSKQGRPCFPENSDTPKGKEMQTVSPENVLETKPKSDTECSQSTNNTSPSKLKAVCTVSNIFQASPECRENIQTPNLNQMQYVYAPAGTQFSAYRLVSESSQENGCIIYIPKFENGVFKLGCAENEGRLGCLESESKLGCAESEGKNKRKRYTPVKTADKGSDPVKIDSDDDDFDGMSSICGETTDTDFEDFDADMQQTPPPGKLSIQASPIPLGFPATWGYPPPAPCRGQGKKVKYAKPLVDHRKSTWMNGFMMFSKLNRSKFTGENPGVHTSQIQKMMGEAWRKLTNEEKQPYRDQAKEWCERMKTAGDNANQNQTDQVKTEIKTGESESNQIKDKKDKPATDCNKGDNSESKSSSSESGLINGLATQKDSPK